MQVERAYPIRADALRNAKKAKGLSWQELADAVDVHPGTIKRWLNGEAALISNIRALATALGLKLNELYDDDDLPKPEGYVDTEVVKAGDYQVLKQPDSLASILAEVKKVVGDKRPIYLLYVGPEASIRIGLRMHKDDAVLLTEAFLAGKLASSKVIGVIPGLPSPTHLQQPLKVWCPQCFTLNDIPRTANIWPCTGCGAQLSIN